MYFANFTGVRPHLNINITDGSRLRLLVTHYRQERAVATLLYLRCVSDIVMNSGLQRSLVRSRKETSLVQIAG